MARIRIDVTEESNKTTQDLVDKFELSMQDTENVVNYLCNEQTKELDDCLQAVRTLLKNPDDITIDQLNYYLMYIPILLYDISQKVQVLGVKSSMAKIERKTKFNEVYMNLKKGTVSHKTAISQNQSIDEQLIEDIYNRVYKTCEDKMEMADLLHSSLKKVHNSKIDEIGITNNNPFS